MGTLGTNIWVFAHLGDLNYLFSFEHSQWWTSDQDLIRMLSLALVNGKFLGMLAILFGVGLEMKYRQSVRLGRPWPGVYLWICGILMAEGLIHYLLVMEFDILMGYAMAAIIVSFLVRGGERSMRRGLWWLGSVHLTLITLLSGVILLIQLDGAEVSLGSMEETIALYQQGSWFEQLSVRLSDFLLLRIEVIFTIPLNVCLMLLGVRLMRSGAFGDDDKGRSIRSRLMKWGIGLGLPLNLMLLIPGGLFDLPVRYVFAPLLSLGYIAVIGLVVEKSKQLSIWSWLANTGRMSLSCYVAQNLLCTVIFYGWGFGLGGQLNAYGVIGMWLLLCLVQIGFATLWLRLFKLGPMEASRQKVAGLFRA
ncbi:DUF418 domain-containing protein [Paenibacillus sp. GCM10023252]|uniref:DUF418 domain-containing protein n=1 Tax=Paenibacillus sp. GCM10023252 TaxID=3252649 RepID=UPI0036088360